ncbi:hypothetical protein [Halobacteriovorax sp. HLS]|uniref:hypothetical protein n=1 Tax=Halobacteriovorax sp. HLS TaxID=2234000 RepID=UPI000FD92A93|nr:hypothetical protein [Halobacteriovorax sp. HLS]
MKRQFKDLIVPLFITLLILTILEIISTSLLPAFGAQKYIIPFNILIVLYLGFKLETPYLAVLILIVQYFHSFFSIEGWELGTIAGIFICIIISYLRDVLHFSSAAITIAVTQVFQVVWFLLVSSLFYLKTNNFTFLVEKMWRFLPESIAISLMAPFFFSIFDRIWGTSGDGMLGEDI